jgi:hypothetical protein
VVIAVEEFKDEVVLLSVRRISSFETLVAVVNEMAIKQMMRESLFEFRKTMMTAFSS